VSSPEYWMRFAIEQAHEAKALDEVPVGAIVVVDDVIVGRGYNQVISAKDPTAHAEIVAMREAGARLGNYRLADASLFVTIEPCSMCAGAMVHARIARLYFGAREPKAGAVGSTIDVLANQALNHRVEVVSGVCEEETAGLMSAFFKSRRNQ
jgi:tRNA(adenine34) deaminase